VQPGEQIRHHGCSTLCDPAQGQNVNERGDRELHRRKREAERASMKMVRWIALAMLVICLLMFLSLKG
jgi:hypothetical protein